MKNTLPFILITGTLLLDAPAAPLFSAEDYSTRPIDNVTLNRADRAFLTDAAAQLIFQRKAAEIAKDIPPPSTPLTQAGRALPTQTNAVVVTADGLARTLSTIEQDLQQVASAKGVALPLEGSLDKNSDFQRLQDTSKEQFEREYAAYAERNARRLLDRFYTASKHARDPRVRAFALRHVRAIYQDFKTARVLQTDMELAAAGRGPAPDSLGTSAGGSMGVAAGSGTTGSEPLRTGRAAEIFAPRQPGRIAEAK